MEVNRDISHENLNHAFNVWRGNKKKTFGDFWVRATGFDTKKISKDIIKETDEWVTYGILFDYIQGQKNA